MTKFFLCTFGCRTNQADSAALRSRLCRSSMIETGCHHDADLIVLNTCTVTQRADQQARQAVRRFRRENPAARIVVTGCYAERDPAALAALPGVRAVIGNSDKMRLAEILDGPLDPSRAEILHSAPEDAAELGIEDAAATGGKTRPFVKLQDGCDARCSYCIVPSVRGPGRSAAPEETIRVIQDLAARGYQEIVLTGVNLGAYGRRLRAPASLASLLSSILAISELGRIRLSSVEPMRFDRAIVRLAAESRAFARHFHIPLQSGSDRILRLMRRPYRASRFLELIEFIDRQVPGVALGTDVMVGFPGETEEDFAATMGVIEKAPLSYLHVFSFSIRPGTDAHKLGAPVEPGAVRERVRLLRELSQVKKLAYRRRFIGRSLPAITLSEEERKGSGLVLTDNFIHARVNAPGIPANRLVTVRLVEVLPESSAAVITDPQ